MIKQRQYSGDETADVLINWTKDPKTAERLAACILKIENYSEIDPSHPLGGRDGKKDLLCKKGDKKFVVGVYFPRKQQTYKTIEKKLLQDNSGVATNKVDSLIFFTNQYLTVGEKTKLVSASKNSDTEIFHREKIALTLNSPVGYGVRLEFLDIELSKSEQLSYFAYKDKEFSNVQKQLSELLNYFEDTTSLKNIPIEKIQQFKNTLKEIVGDSASFFLYGNSMIDRLKVPLSELQEFEKTVSYLTGGFLNSPLQKLHVPLRDLEKFQDLLNTIVGTNPIFFNAPINRLAVPLHQLEMFNDKLNETIDKLDKIEKLKTITAT